MQSQVVCRGCRSLLLYPSGASNVCCALCSTVTPIPTPGMELAQLICRGCRTLLMYARGATTVRCSCCHIVNYAPGPNQVAHVNCGNCQTTLMYPSGAPSVKCAVCHYVTNVNMANVRVPIPFSTGKVESLPRKYFDAVPQISKHFCEYLFTYLAFVTLFTPNNNPDGSQSQFILAVQVLTS